MTTAATITPTKKRGRPRIEAPEVRKGQSWVSQRTYRKLIVETISRKNSTAACRYVDDGSKVTIKLDRFRPTSEGYALAEEAQTKASKSVSPTESNTD